MHTVRSLVSALSTCALAAAGGGCQRAPTGPHLGIPGDGPAPAVHYDLDLMAVPTGMTAATHGQAGDRIYVRQSGRTRIGLRGGSEFRVVDGDATDGDGALFELPSTAATTYAVQAQAFATPEGTATLEDCAAEPGTGAIHCSDLIHIALHVESGRAAEDVAGVLLAPSITVDPSLSPDLASCLGIAETRQAKVSPFDPCLQGYLWEYAGGMKQVRLRFYATD